VSLFGTQRVHAVRGGYSVDAALAILLRGTGLFVAMRTGNVISLALHSTPSIRPARPRPNTPSPPPKAPGARTSAEEQPAIVVTGTRIARPEIDSAMPVTVRSAQTMRAFGYNGAYDTLVQSPAIGPGLGISNSQGEAWDVGISSINLRSMGVNRSLVLVDGKRWVSGGARTSAVDLNSIPDALIDRVEIVTGGAAAIYGADAVTGVVNIITKKNITGVQLSASNGISQKGDARQTNVSATAGFPFGKGRGSFDIGVTYNSTAPLGYVDRYSNRTGFTPNPADTGRNDGIPDNILDGDIRDLKRSTTPTIFYDGRWYILDNGSLAATGYDTAINTGPLSTGHGGPGANGFENHFLRNKLVLASLYSRIRYDLGGATRWNATVAYAHSYARAPSVFPEVRDDLRPTNWWGGTTGGLALLTNPYLPEPLRAFLSARDLTSVPFNRTYANLHKPFEIHERDYVTVGTDLSGRLTDRLKWSAFLQRGQMRDDVTTTNMIRHVAWLNARDVIRDSATGQPVCAQAAAQAAGCVPFNIFTTERPSQAFLDYVEADRYERRENILYTAGGSINGGVARLPYGDVLIAAGVEWRWETLSTRDDPDTAKLTDIVFKPGVDYVLHPTLDARRKTVELYGEAAVPVLRDLCFAHRLELEGAYRFSRYSDEPATSTWKVGGQWQPTPGLGFRGVYSHSVRVPNFGELYSPELVQTVGITNDPCSGAFIRQGPNRANNCASLLPGLALPLTYPNTNAPTVYLGGNPKLTPETSNSLTLGAVVPPGVVPGFDLTVDYWDIRIAEVVTALPYLNILNLCVDSASGIDNFYCRLIRRNANGQIVSVRADNYNLARQRARGIDIGGSYRHRLGPGRILFRFDGTYLIEQTTVGAPGTEAIDYAGQWNYPRLRATLTTTYGIGRLLFGLNTRFVSRSVFDVTDASSETRNPYRVPRYTAHDVMIQYRPSASYTLTLGVRNIGNVGIFGPLQDTAPGPNSSGGAQTGAAYYDRSGAMSSQGSM
jgi:iron complex outermembrane receptor protein